MAKKVTLPILERHDEDRASKGLVGRPSIDLARSRLGGATSETDVAPKGLAPGVIVEFATHDHKERLFGAVLFASASEVHVLTDGVTLRKVAPAELVLHERSDSATLTKIAADARLFGLVVRGQSVRYADGSGELIDGTVVEKCRWGALVERSDGVVIAVGFRKLWPHGPPGSVT